MGFRELPHTADLAIEVWAPDLATLFVEAARGLSFVAGMQLEPGPHITRSIHLDEIDDEGLLVAFLTELVYAQEQESLGFDDFSLEITNHHLDAEMSGGPIRSLAKPIKAVTYHNMEIRRTDRKCEVQIVMDV